MTPTVCSLLHSCGKFVDDNNRRTGDARKGNHHAPLTTNRSLCPRSFCPAELLSTELLSGGVFVRGYFVGLPVQ